MEKRGAVSDGVCCCGTFSQVTSDDKHTIHIWRWLPHADKYINAHYIPGWYFGPEKKVFNWKGGGGARLPAASNALGPCKPRA